MGKDAFLSKIAGCQRILLDTNSIIYFLQNVNPYSTILKPLFSLCEGQKLAVFISLITEAELLVGPLKEDNKETLAKVQLFLNTFPGFKVIPISRQIGYTAASIRAKTNLRLPDALIIATAQAAGCEMIIGNDLAWSKIDYPEVILLDKYISEQMNQWKQ
jgi:predicted nucleic acid-binding protein